MRAVTVPERRCWEQEMLVHEPVKVRLVVDERVKRPVPPREQMERLSTVLADAAEIVGR